MHQNMFVGRRNIGTQISLYALYHIGSPSNHQIQRAEGNKETRISYYRQTKLRFASLLLGPTCIFFHSKHKPTVFTTFYLTLLQKRGQSTFLGCNSFKVHCISGTLQRSQTTSGRLANYNRQTRAGIIFKTLMKRNYCLPSIKWPFATVTLGNILITEDFTLSESSFMSHGKETVTRTQMRLIFLHIS